MTQNEVFLFLSNQIQTNTVKLGYNEQLGTGKIRSL